MTSNDSPASSTRRLLLDLAAAPSLAVGALESPTSPPSSGHRRLRGRASRLLLPARPAEPAAPGLAAEDASASLQRGLSRQALSFALIGVASTAAYVAIYAALRVAMPAAPANAIALLVTALGNTAANRRLTFAVRGRDRLARDHAAGLAALAVALALTSASLGLLDVVTARPSRLLELAVLVTANALASGVRFLLLRLALDRKNGPLPAIERIPR